MSESKPSVPSAEDKEMGVHKHQSPADPAASPQHPEDLAAEAKQAADAEQQMTLREAIRTYPKAIGWSVLLSSTLIMEGYDLSLLSNLYSSPYFNQKYGEYSEAQGKYVLSAAWQSGLSNGARAGEVFGLILAGWTADRYGYRITTIGFLIMMIAFIFVLFFAPNIQILVLGEVLCGVFHLKSGRVRPPFRILTLKKEFRGALSRVSRLPTLLKSRPSCSDRISRPSSTCAGWVTPQRQSSVS